MLTINIKRSEITQFEKFYKGDSESCVIPRSQTYGHFQNYNSNSQSRVCSKTIKPGELQKKTTINVLNLKLKIAISKQSKP